MTAIAGVWRFDGRPDTGASCARMLTAQQIYGSDDVSHWSRDDVAIGRGLTRLVPEDRFDSQPLVGGGGRFVLVADIRLDNRDALADELKIPAPRAADMSDADILLAAVERWEERCVEHLVGDYAFACWNGASRRMLFARDPLGQQPLHYHLCNRFFAFASMPKGLHALPEVPYEPDEEKVTEKLLLMTDAGTRSFFKGVERVPPGHLAVVYANTIKLTKHWHPKRDTVRYSNPNDYAEALRDLLDKAVRSRLRSSDNLGVYLSGGLDSGAVAATAARLLTPSGRRLFAFTGVPRRGYHDPELQDTIYDEGPYASATAALYPNIEHVLVNNEGCSSERPAVADLDGNFYLYDRPSNGFSDAGISRSLQKALKAKNVRVVLSGNAGNCGLSYDGMHLLPELLRSGRWLHLLREAHALVRSARMGWRGVARETLGPWCPATLWVWLHRATGRDFDEFSNSFAINPKRFSNLDPERLKAHDFAWRPWKDAFAFRMWQLLRNDPGNYRKGILGGYKVDQRDPTADVRLLNFCLGIPTDQFLKNGVPRALALSALADRLPGVVLENRRHARQASDWHQDLTVGRDAMAAELDRIEGCPMAAAAIDIPRLRNDLRNWPTGGWHRFDVTLRYRFALPRAIAAGHFLRSATRSNQ